MMLGGGFSNYQKVFKHFIIIRLGKSPGSSQQSALDGKVDGQLSMPHIKLPLQSLSESQSPWFNLHWLDCVQQLQSRGFPLQTFAKFW